MPALVQLAATCGHDPWQNLKALALAAWTGQAAVERALAETLDLRPALQYEEPPMDEGRFRELDRLMREQAGGELGSAV